MHYPDDILLEICSDCSNIGSLIRNIPVSRIELCSSLSEGGLTPPLSLTEKVCGESKVPVHIMVRPRRGDFLYSKNEFELMKADIRHAAKAGASGVVFGILRDDGSIDRERCRELLDIANPLHVTFHRAFDMAADPFFALEEIIAIGCNTLLTSGQRQTAEDGLELIREMIKRAANRIEIMAGGGINQENVLLLYKAGVKSFHFTARKASNGGMKYKNPALQTIGSAGPDDEYANFIFDEGKVLGIVNAINSA